jgi:hypothetical protein
VQGEGPRSVSTRIGVMRVQVNLSLILDAGGWEGAKVEDEIWTIVEGPQFKVRAADHGHNHGIVGQVIEKS